MGAPRPDSYLARVPTRAPPPTPGLRRRALGTLLRPCAPSPGAPGSPPAQRRRRRARRLMLRGKPQARQPSRAEPSRGGGGETWQELTAGRPRSSERARAAPAASPTRLPPSLSSASPALPAPRPAAAAEAAFQELSRNPPHVTAAPATALKRLRRRREELLASARAPLAYGARRENPPSSALQDSGRSGTPWGKEKASPTPATVCIWAAGSCTPKG